MPLFINQEKVDSKLIIEEMERMRSEYEKAFQGMDAEARENQLLEWARDNIVERVLIRQHAENDKRPIPRKEIEAAYQKLKSDYKNGNAFFKAMGVAKRDIPRLKRELEVQLRVERLIEEIGREIEPPNDSDIHAYYQANQQDFLAAEQVHAAHIVKHTNQGQDPEQAAREIRAIQQEIQAGRSFNELASEHSDCPDSMGDLGWFPRGRMVEEFENVVFHMNPGEVSDVFRTPFGFHIAKLLGKRDAAPKPVEAVGSQIMAKLIAERKDARVESFVDSLKLKADIRFEMDEVLEMTLGRNAYRNKGKQYFRKPLTNILVKPSGPDCNMACEYCFYLEKESLFKEMPIHRMNDDTLREMIKQVMMQAGDHIGFGWQGGEPTLMGLDFFRNVVRYQREFGRGQTVQNGLQTNGLLLNPEWAKFLKDHQFLVGLSIDGPEHVHDKYRRTKGGQPTWTKVHENGRMLLREGAAVNALSVLTDYSVRFPEEIYHFHKEMGFTHMQFIPCVETDKNNPKIAAPFSVSPENYGDFLCTLFDLWRADFNSDQPTTFVRFFDSVFHSYVGYEPPLCTLMRECGIYVVVEHNGDVYSCDFYVEPQWKLGNVHEDQIIELLNCETQKRFGERKLKLEKSCLGCEWLAYCRGGCPKDRSNDPRDKNVSHFCGAYKKFFNHAHGELLKLAELWKSRQAKPNLQLQRTASGSGKKIGRNDPCPCGSGKKFKKCCDAVDNRQ
jgi:uncharacterized protein